MNLDYRIRPLVAAVLLGGLSAPLAAQQTDATSAEKEENSPVLQTVIVTAQHREENIQEVPVAVTAVDAGAASEAVQRTHDLFTFVPNAAAENPDGESRPRIYIRGLGTGDVAANTVLPVGLYADGVYLNAPISAGGALFDLDRVEVLRGPQGTLYGKNTTGGVINYISRKPVLNENGGYVTLAVGSENQRTVEGVVNGGGEKIAVRGSFFTESRDGFIDNLATGETAGDLEREAARLQILVKPTEDFDALLKLHRRKHDGNGSNGSLIIGTYNPGTPIAYTRPHGRYIDNSVYQDEEILHEGASLTLNKGFGGITLTSITSYDITDNFVLGGGGNNPLENHTRSRSDVSWEQATQELRLSSSDQQRLRWITGVHLFKEQLDSTAVAARYQQSLAQLPAPLVAQSAATPGYRITSYDHETESAGIYGNIAFDFTEQFTVTAGLRWSTEKKDLQIALRQYNVVDLLAGNFWDERFAGNPAPDVNQTRSLSETWKDWSWDLTPEYRFTDNLRGFFRYARGFRSGGLNVGVQNSLDPVRAVEPEYVNSYEIGIKSEWLDERLIVNANVFYYDYEDIQTNLLVPNPAGGITSALANGPEARAQGVELEIDGLITDTLRGRLAAAVLDSEYRQFINRNPITGEITGDNSGNRLVRSPRVTIGAGLEHTLGLGNGAKVITGGDISYRGREFFLVDRQDAEADPSLTQAGYTVANARVTYVVPDGHIRVTAFVNNLTDKFYQVHGRPNGPAPQYVETYGNPRTYGVSLTYEY